MFNNIHFKELQWLDNGVQVGIIKVNDSFSWKQKMIRPFKRVGVRTILSIGRVNYALLDNFIIASLNDYYTKMNAVTSSEKRAEFLKEYNDLYNLWYTINVAKQQNDPALNGYYDDLVYRLYLLGYKNS